MFYTESLLRSISGIDEQDKLSHVVYLEWEDTDIRPYDQHKDSVPKAFAHWAKRACAKKIDNAIKDRLRNEFYLDDKSLVKNALTSFGSADLPRVRINIFINDSEGVPCTISRRKGSTIHQKARDDVRYGLLIKDIDVDASVTIENLQYVVTPKQSSVSLKCSASFRILREGKVLFEYHYRPKTLEELHKTKNAKFDDFQIYKILKSINEAKREHLISLASNSGEKIFVSPVSFLIDVGTLIGGLSSEGASMSELVEFSPLYLVARYNEKLVEMPETIQVRYNFKRS